MRQFWHGLIDLAPQSLLIFLLTQTKAAVLLEAGHFFVLTHLFLLSLNLLLAKETLRVPLKTNLFFVHIECIPTNTRRLVRTE